MVTLFHSARARSLRPLWALEELGLEYNLEMRAFPPRQQPEYIKMNPLGTVPFLIDGDIVMHESVAMCHYLASRYGPSDLALTPAEAEFGPFLNWLTFGEASLTSALSLVIHYGGWYSKTHPEVIDHPDVTEYYRDSFFKALNTVETAMRGRDYLVGGRFTVADISVGYNFRLLEMLGLLGDVSPAMQAYWARLSARPAYRKTQEINAAFQAAPA